MWKYLTKSVSLNRSRESLRLGGAILSDPLPSICTIGLLLGYVR